MAAGTFTFYNTGKLSLIGDNTANDINWIADTIVAILVLDTYALVATHSVYSDVSAHECADPDYAPVVLGSKTVVNNAGTIEIDAADADFGASVTISAATVILVRRAGGSLVAGDRLIGYMDLNTSGGNVSSTNASFIARWGTKLATLT